ncbi:MAG TPA: putative Ig domain-containing protein, partial [Blastocatellia bacterium]
GRLNWNAQVCGDGALTVTAASSTDNTTFSAAQNVTRGQDLTVPDGRYLRISVLFRRATTGESPILYDLSVGTEGYAPPPQTNTPPTVDAGTDLSTALFVPVKLKGTACDDGLPTGTLSFTWSKVSGPSAVTFANANALATTATINTPGAYVLRLTVSDGASTVSDDINVTIEGTNSQPVISSTAPTSTCSTRPYSYQVIATDPNFGDLLTYSLPTAPAGMTINAATGLIQWTPSAGQIGSHSVTVRVVDLGNNQAEQNFTVNVAATPATNTAPTITSTAPTAGVVSLLYTYQAAATDPDPCETLAWSLDVAPAGMTINSATGLIQWTPSAAQTGNQNVTVRAHDFSGASATQSFTINVVASLLPPTVAISAPAPGSAITQLVNIVGTVGDPNGASGPPVTWQVELRREGSSTYKTIGSGTGPVTNGTLAPFDPTMLANDVYYVRLSAEKGFEYREVEAPYSVVGDLKLGNFTISFTDLTIPVAGIPIAITRSYDSLDTSPGEFGAGWRLGLAGNVRDTASEVIMETFRVGTRVYVTRPDGKRVGFTFAPYRATSWFPGLLPAFTPDPGVYDTLEVAQDLLINAGDGSVLDILGGTYNPDRYFLKTKENITYEIDEIEGLKKVTDINGNTLTVTPTGITSSTGVSVAFERDAQNRITKITEPTSTPTDPRELKYSYDANGNLTQFLDQMNNATKYSYGYTQFPNYLTRIEDPLNRAIARNVFDNQGRLIGVCDANGDVATLAGCVKLDPNAASSLQTIFNARGFRTDLILDDRGNVLTERRFLNGANFLDTVRTYDANNNMLTEKDPANNTKRFTYDTRGNVLTATDAGSRTTTYTYNTTCNKAASVTDPANNVTTYEYDDKCNLRFVREPLNRTTEYRYNAQGQRTEMIPPLSGSWIWAYDGNGFLQSLTDPFGKATQFVFNGSGDLLSRTDRNNRRIEFEYDAA